MTRMATRYGQVVDAYELCNEPNFVRFWPSGPDPAEYVRLLKAGATAVRAADPTAEVVFGGTQWNDYEFLEGAYTAEPQLGRYFDVMAVHPYTPLTAPSPEEIRRGTDGRITKDSFAGYREVRKVMNAHGDDKPIWATEMGWATTTEGQPAPGVTERMQADFLEHAYRFLEQDPFVEVAFWYNLRNNYLDQDADTWETQMGLLRTDFTPKLSYEAFKGVGESEDAPVEPNAAAPSSAPSVTVPAMSLRVDVGGRSERRRHRLPVTVTGELRDHRSGQLRMVIQRPVARHGSIVWRTVSRARLVAGRRTLRFPAHAPKQIRLESAGQLLAGSAGQTCSCGEVQDLSGRATWPAIVLNDAGASRRFR